MFRQSAVFLLPAHFQMVVFRINDSPSPKDHRTQASLIDEIVQYPDYTGKPRRNSVPLDHRFF